ERARLPPQPAAGPAPEVDLQPRGDDARQDRGPRRQGLRVLRAGPPGACARKEPDGEGVTRSPRVGAVPTRGHHRLLASLARRDEPDVAVDDRVAVVLQID